jgi:hypothetical protein
MWNRIKAFFFESETIAWARIQAALGAVALILTYVEPTVLAPISPSEWVPGFLVANGIATEFLRRRRDPAFSARSAG